MLRFHGGLLVALIVAGVFAIPAYGAGGPLGIDHRLTYDNSGIWKRSDQKDLMDTLIGLELAGGLWEGGNTRVGKTFPDYPIRSAIFRYRYGMGGVSTAA